MGIKSFVLASCFSILAIGASKASTINYAGNGGTVGLWGPSSGGNQTYGQIFTAPDAFLEDYALTVASYPGNPLFNFVSQIYQWNGTGVVGPALYTSGVQTTTSTLTTYDFVADVSITSGGQYIALVTNQPNGISLGGSGEGIMELSSASGSKFTYTVGNPTTDPWTCGACGGWGTADFQANFSTAAPVPGPTVGAGASGFALAALFLGWLVRRRGNQFA